MLHAFQCCTSEWCWVETAGSIGFIHCEGLVVFNNTLLAVGWSPPKRSNTKADCHMQVGWL